MRISDWSSDVCSSDLHDRRWRDGSCRRVLDRAPERVDQRHHALTRLEGGAADDQAAADLGDRLDLDQPVFLERAPRRDEIDDRSEEHTSELQSLMRHSSDVLCLKKKKTRLIKATHSK